MSRTDKTRPTFVKLREHTVEVHDHRNGMCDLASGSPEYGWTRGKCYLDAQWWRPEFRCGHTCTCVYGWWEQKKSKDRRARKAAARNWWKEYE